MSFSTYAVDRIKDAREFIVTKNPSKAPYHSTAHMATVAHLATGFYNMECNRTDTPCDEAILLQLHIAGLFHDFGHTGGHKDDATNISIAVAAVKAWGATYLRQEDLDAVVALIKVTQFPFIHEPVSVAEKCLRDADLLYTAYVNDPRVVLEALRSEIEIARQVPVSHREMLEGQLKFMAGATLFTESGKAYWDEVTPKYLSALTRYVGLLEQGFDVHPNCGCMNRAQITPDDVRGVWWHQAAIAYKDALLNPTSSVERDKFPVTYTHDLDWLGYLKKLGAYLGEARLAAFPKAQVHLAHWYAEALAERNLTELEAEQSFGERSIHASCPDLFQRLKSEIHYLYRLTSL